jgi:hypothetical protein
MAMRYLCAGSCSVRSTTVASAAAFLTASMPFSALAFPHGDQPAKALGQLPLVVTFRCRLRRKP